MPIEKRVFVLITLSILLALMATGTSCQNGQQATGTLQGAVTIGPIWPVERPGENPPAPPQVFEARKVVIYNKLGTKIVKTIDLSQIGQSSTANYSTQLKPGKYVVDISHIGIDRSSEVPTRIEIKPDQTVVVDIEIDTGIR